MSRYDLTDFEWRVIESLLPNKPRGVPRVDDRRVLSGIFWVLRSGAPWRDMPSSVGRLPPFEICHDPVERRDASLIDIVPRDPKLVYSMRRVLSAVVDQQHSHRLALRASLHPVAAPPAALAMSSTASG